MANRDSGTISKLTPSGSVSTFAAGLYEPNGLLLDKMGDLYVSEWNGTIVRFTPGGSESTFVSSGLSDPIGMAFDNAGNLYVANYGNDSISRIPPAGQASTFVTGLSGSPQWLAFSPVPEPSALTLLGTALLGLGVVYLRRGAKPANSLVLTPNDANYYISNYTDSTNYLTPVGYFSTSPSYYGTFDQSGDVWNWTDTIISRSYRRMRAGAWNLNSGSMASQSSSYVGTPTDENDFIGFRVAASVPEPGSLALLLAGTVAFGIWRLRRKT